MLRKGTPFNIVSAVLTAALFALVSTPSYAQYTVLALHDWLPNRQGESRIAGVSNNRVLGTVINSVRAEAEINFLWDLTTRTATQLRPELPASFNKLTHLILTENHIQGTAYNIHTGKPHAFFWDIPAQGEGTLRLSTTGENDSSPELCAPIEAMTGPWAVGRITHRKMEDRLQDALDSLWMRKMVLRDAQADKTPMLWNTVTGVLHLLPKPSLGDQSIVIPSALSGNYVVGYCNAGAVFDASDYAIAWELTTGKIIDLHQLLPPNSTDSEATAIQNEWACGNFEVLSGPRRAVAWNLASRTSVDLHLWLSKDYLSSNANSVATSRVIGRAWRGVRGGRYQAILWELKAQTAINLHTNYLKAAGFSDSQAVAIDRDGVIIGTGRRNNRTEAWALVLTKQSVRVPEPATYIGKRTSPWSDYLLLGGCMLTLLLAISVIIGTRKSRRIAPHQESGGQRKPDSSRWPGW